MSLLNDMLRDLSNQQKLLAKTTADNHDLLQQTTLFKKKSVNWLPVVIVFLIVFLVVLGIKYFLSAAGIVNVKTVHENIPSLPYKNQQLPALPSAATNTPVNAVNNTAVEKIDVAPVSVNVEAKSIAAAAFSENENDRNTQLNAQINDLLQQANRAFSVDKLTSPIEDNAYSYFQKILTIAPNQLQAQAGLDAIAARYLAKARDQLALGNREQADTFMRRAHFVAPEYFKQHDFMSAEQASDAIASETIALESHAHEAEVAPAPVIAPPVTDTTSISVPRSETLNSSSVVNSEAVKSESIKPFVVTESVPVNVVPNAAWKDEQLAEQAQQLLTQGKKEKVIALLKNFVANEAKPIASTLLLFDIYLQQGDLQAAEALVNHVNYLPIVEKTKAAAQLLVARGDELAAINILAQQLSAAENNEPYRALLASLYHKTGQYPLSVVSYQRLLSSFGDKPAYWLGLALAFDGLAQYKNALQAYLHLREFPQLQQQVKAYSEKRIAALRSE